MATYLFVCVCLFFYFPLVSKHGASMKKPASPRKEEIKVGLKSSGADKVVSDISKKITKPVSANDISVKPNAKTAKVSSAPGKQSPVVAAKSGPKLKSANGLSVEKVSPKTSKTLPAAASKNSITKGREAMNNKKSDCKPELGPSENISHSAEQKDIAKLEHTERIAPHSTQPGDSVHTETSPWRAIMETEAQSGNKTRKGITSNNISHVKFAAGSTCKQAGGSKVQQSQSSVHLNGGQTHKACLTNSPKDTEHPADTSCSMESTDTPMEDSWSGLHHQVSPESETGSTHTTSSDDIKPRSEDYDAGGSQDDDCSNDRGVSKCGTMRCHDFLGRSSSDTSTPEELKMYEGGAGLRVEVRLRGREPETTSEDEGIRQRPRSWLHRDEVPVKEKHSEMEAALSLKSIPDHQLFSSEEEEDDDEDETEDERSEVEVIPGQTLLPSTEPSPHYQGIVNLAFDDDGVDQENDQPEYQTTSNFRRSVLLSVDECEELGSDEGGVQTPPQQPDEALTPCDVFESDSTTQFGDAPSKDQHSLLPHHLISTRMMHKEHEDDKSEKRSIFLTEIQDSVQDKSSHMQVGEVKSSHLELDSRDLAPQERPCHLDLRPTEQYHGGMSKNIYSLSESKKVELQLDLNETHQTGGSPVRAAQSPTGNV